MQHTRKLLCSTQKVMAVYVLALQRVYSVEWIQLQYRMGWKVLIADHLSPDYVEVIVLNKTEKSS